MDQLIQTLLSKVNDALAAMPVGTFLDVLTALAVSLFIVQLIKAAMKMYKSASSLKERNARRIFNFVISVLVGAISAIYFIEETGNWPFLIGLFNSGIYLFLVRLAYAKNWMVMLSLLKSRKLVRNAQGNLSLEETQRFDAR